MEDKDMNKKRYTKPLMGFSRMRTRQLLMVSLDQSTKSASTNEGSYDKALGRESDEDFDF